MIKHIGFIQEEVLGHSVQLWYALIQLEMMIARLGLFVVTNFVSSLFRTEVGWLRQSVQYTVELQKFLKKGYFF